MRCWTEEASVRALVAEALGRLGPEAKAAVPELVKRIADADEGTRVAAIEALGEIGGADDSVPAIEQALKDPDHFVRVKAVEALESSAVNPPRRPVLSWPP